MNIADFSDRLLAWYDQHGRHDLPWQSEDPYRVWVSEIMLQQTQVSTVIPYFERFMQRFPHVASLAAAELDEVLHLWTGLGYYARGRNLHKAARAIVREHGGLFPQQLEQVMALPGIGRSTAGAVLAQAANQRHPILDGNVKRVLCRLHAVEGWSGEKQIEQQLWKLAADYTPTQRVADYTQAIMDLGATLCTRSKPGCDRCTFVTDCQAYQQERVTDFPYARPKKSKPVKQTRMLILTNERDEVLLQQRPPSGLWGGLWTLPQCDDTDADLTLWTEEQLGLQLGDCEPWPTLRHSFSHYHLDITPIRATARTLANRVMEGKAAVWYNSRQPDARGLAAPVVKLLEKLQQADHL